MNPLPVGRVATATRYSAAWIVSLVAHLVNLVLFINTCTIFCTGFR